MIMTINKNPHAPMTCAIDTLINELIDPAALDVRGELADEVPVPVPALPVALVKGVLAEAVLVEVAELPDAVGPEVVPEGEYYQIPC
jgi:hypothetical protein